MKSILDGVTVRSTGRADAHDPVVAEADKEIHKQVQDTAVQARVSLMHVNLHVTDWVATQWEDPILRTVIEWISNWKVEDLKHLLGDDMITGDGNAIPCMQKKADTLPSSPLPSPHTNWQVGKSFAVHSPHGSSSGCHEWMSPRCWNQGQQQTLYLLQDLF